MLIFGHRHRIDPMRATLTRFWQAIRRMFAPSRREARTDEQDDDYIW